MRIVLFSFTVTLLLLTGCFSDSSPTGSNGNPNEKPFPVAKSAVERTSTVLSKSEIEQQAASINEFALAIYKQMASRADNLFFSPYSIVSALGMTEAGAKGNTASQIREALSVTLAGNAFHAAMNGLDQDLMGHADKAEGITLNVVNSTWMQTGWDFKVSYLDLLGRYYGAGVNLMDFMTSPEPSRVIINTWVEDQTNKKIKDLIPPGAINSLTRLVLTNAIYFLADWKYQFTASLTQNEDFTKLDNSKVKAPLMQLGKANEEVKMEYAYLDSARSINLPYKGNRICMTVFLPEKGTFTTFENNLTAAKISEFVSAMDSTKLPPVRLPKFTFKTGSISLKNALQNLGMKDAFLENQADFSGIDGRKDLCISDVIHKAFIAVDEKGTEAAAATAVIIRATGIIENKPEFIADRPFIYVIRDIETGTILFMGRVLDPIVEG